MDVVSSIYLASFAGAGLFFGSGFFLGKNRTQEIATNALKNSTTEVAENGDKKAPFTAKQSIPEFEKELSQIKEELRKEHNAKTLAEQQVQELQQKLQQGAVKSTLPPVPSSSQEKQLRVQIAALEAKTKAQEAELSLQRKELDRLSEQRDLTIHSKPLSPVPINNSSASAPTAQMEGETVSATLEHQLRFLTDQQNCQAAVIADSQGLLIAAAGIQAEYFDALGAVSGLVLELVQKTQDYLPLERINSFELGGANQLGIQSRIVKIDEEALVVTTLGNISPVPTDRIEMVAKTLPNIVNQFL